MSEKKESNNANSVQFSELIREFDLKNVRTGEPVQGRIVDVFEDRVIVDIGQKTEGILDKKEITDLDGKLKYQVNDVITVIPVSVNFKEGYIIVSKKRYDEQIGWDNVLRAYKKNIPILGRVLKIAADNKGLIVDAGIEMYLPNSQIDINRVSNPQKYVGKELWFKVTKLSQREKSGVVSRRVLLEEERREKIKKIFETVKAGDLVKGTVTTITDYGAFIDIGGVEGLLRKEDISYGRVAHPREKLRKGDEIEVKVLEIDTQKEKIALGLKQKHPDPWANILEKYPVGKRLIAKVVKIVDFGAFIELEDGVEALLHISDLTWDGRPQNVEEYVAAGEKLWVQIIEVNPEKKKIKVGLKQLELRPEEKYLQEHHAGEVVRGVVKKILKTRAFVELEDKVEGVIKISDICYFHIDSIHDYLKEGDEIAALILSNELDENSKVQLGLKQLSDKDWKDFYLAHKHGDLLEVVVKKTDEKGVTVEITKNIEGFIRLADVSPDEITLEHLEQEYPVGKKCEAMLLKVDPDRKKVFLIFKAVSRKKEREEMEKYMSSGDEGKRTFGDLLQISLKKIKKSKLS